MVVKNPWHEIDVGKESPKIVNAIIEIPKDSHLKYELDKETGMLKLDRFLYSAVHYPGDYGFIPQTLWDDGDPLDIIVLTGRPVYPMTLTSVRIIGVLRMVDSDEKDDKLIGIYDCDPRYKEYQNIGDIPKHTISELKYFFETYKELQGKKCKILKILGKEEAFKDVLLGQKLYAEEFGLQNKKSNILTKSL
ncbi:inorganic pyrophosphatase [Candidatus Pacearchaeota archaeon CG10_big_fil_rev_8_21_14_0_10_31_24]|nr:MAG: inorganic pyrophosphatase [Candidatus Pacearchaeota archaeon CG10_big_fil_rev_8_21_14_0_10_31_24]